MSTETFVTVREIAETLGRSVYSVRYAVDSRGIEPARRAGLVRLFDTSAINATRDALVEIDAKRTTNQEDDA